MDSVRKLGTLSKNVDIRDSLTDKVAYLVFLQWNLNKKQLGILTIRSQ